MTKRERYCPWCGRVTEHTRELVFTASELTYPVDECQECGQKSPVLAKESEDA